MTTIEFYTEFKSLYDLTFNRQYFCNKKKNIVISKRILESLYDPEDFLIWLFNNWSQIAHKCKFDGNPSLPLIGTFSVLQRLISLHDDGVTMNDRLKATSLAGKQYAEQF